MRSSNFARALLSCILVVLAFAAKSSAEEPETLWTTDELTRGNLQLLVGPDTKIELCDLAEESCLRKIGSLSGARKITIIAVRDQVDSILAERLGNLGQPILYLDTASRQSGELATYLQLRSVCRALVRCFPDRATEFRSRLTTLRNELRIRANIRPVRPSPGYAQCLRDFHSSS